MKNAIYIALIFVAMIPAHAQDRVTRDRDAEGASASVQGYADRVNGLLRDVHARLHEISEREEAGELTPQQARELKLAATRDMIARLETVSAVYDAKIAAGEHSAHEARLRMNGAVSVGELERERVR
jgi:hypothetical protein